MDNINLKNDNLYLNRELSLLQFQWRVLAQASDETVPLLERLHFLCISSTNLDEFFQIRIAGLMHRAALETSSGNHESYTPEEALSRIREETHQLVADQYTTLNDILFPALEKENIRFLKRAELDEKRASWIKRYFTSQILPVLSPLGLDHSHPFPRVLSKTLNFIISLQGKDAFGRESRLAIVQAPRSLPRMIKLPDDLSEGDEFIFLSSIIHIHISDLFPGMDVTGCYQFRVTRDSDLFVDEEETVDLMGAIKGELSSRRLTDAVRLEVADNCSNEAAEYLLGKFKLTQEDLYQVNGPVNLGRFNEMIDLVDRSDLKFPPFTQSISKRLFNSPDIFEVIQHGDVLLNHPFESFAPVVDFIKQASSDPKVLAIKQTLYRTGANSPLVDALVEAAKAGKEVTVVVELRARFDEAANIEQASRLQEAGAHVVYGVVGYKTHAKMILVVRREGRTIKRYVHLGTGNYHVGNARVYTDYGLLTCDKEISEDVHKVFLQLTGLGKATKLKKLLQAPFTLQQGLIKLINNEIEIAKSGKPARIIAKMNALTEPKIIRSLYRASQDGVKVDLIVRGICRLKPGVKGVSDNIQVRSVVGRFLEHSRIYYFEQEGKVKVYCSSADWMDRNFFKRVEVCFPIEDEALKKQLIKDGLLAYLSDNMQAWQLLSDGTYKRLVPASNQKKRSAQNILLEKIAAEV